VKINEIVNEGFVSSLAKGLLPEPVQKVIDTPYKQKPEISDNEAARRAYKMYGINPEFDQRRFDAMLIGLPDDVKREVQNKIGEISYYTDWQLAQYKRNIEAVAAEHQAYLKKMQDDNEEMKSRPAQAAQAMLAKDIFGQGKSSQGKNVSSATAGSQPVGNPANDPSQRGQA
jgi:hypothetical protein